MGVEVALLCSGDVGHSVCRQVVQNAEAEDHTDGRYHKPVESVPILKHELHFWEFFANRASAPSFPGAWYSFEAYA